MHLCINVRNRLKTATGITGDTVDYTQENKYNGFGQRVEKKEGTDVTNYFYDGTAVLYTTDAEGNKTSFNFIGAEDNILSTARIGADNVADFYVYTKDVRESTTNVIGSDGLAEVSYTYDEYGKTTEYQQDESDPFYNEICYTAGVYDATTGLYNLNARYYSPAAGTFLTQDTYRGSLSRTSTLNYYAYCAGNPISYTDPSGHAAWAIVGAALGAYDGYQYAKKKNLKGWKKAAAIAGGAVLGAVNPFKVVKAAKTVAKVAKAGKYTKAAASAKKTTKVVKKVKAKPKQTVVAKKSTKTAVKTSTAKKTAQTVKKQQKTVKAACFTAGTKIHTKDGYKNIEAIKVGDYVWSENPETKEKALKKVKKIFVREKDSIIRLAINGEAIETTDEHPFYVEGKGFIAAGELKASDEVRLQSGEAGVVDYIEEVQLDKPINVYNFEVEDFHTYYVSEQKVLVHNTCAGVSGPIVKNSTSIDTTASIQVPNIGFNNFNGLKKYMGNAGEGNAWHHIVEQSQIKNSGFEATQIHNVNNIIAIPHGKGTVHAKISGHYNSKQPYTGGKTVREWLRGQSFNEQFEYGMRQLKQYGDVIPTEKGYVFKPFD